MSRVLFFELEIRNNCIFRKISIAIMPTLGYNVEADDWRSTQEVVRDSLAKGAGV